MLSDDEFDDVDLKQLKKNFKDYYDGDRNEEGERHGFGSAQFSNGDKYEGEYREGKRNGIGKYVFLNRARYEGEYVNGMRKGKGIMTYPDGTTYNGEWEDNKRHGQGIYTYRNGDYYDGEWKEGRKHGKGRYVFVGQGIMYDGAWDYDRYEGEGSLVTNSYTFKGVFSEQEPIGDGVYTFNNNCAQHGEYIMNRQLKYIQGEVTEVFVPKWFCTALATTGIPREKNIFLS